MRRFRKIGFGGIGQVIAAAYDSLGFSSLADTFGAWYVSQTPTGNVIEDETPSRKDRTELATTGSVFDGIDQGFDSGSVLTATGKTVLSVFGLVTPGAIGGSTQYTVASEYNAVGDDRSWTLRFFGNKLRVVLSGDGTGTNLKNYNSVRTFSSGITYHVGFVFDQNTVKLFANGEELEVTKDGDDTVNTLFDASSPLRIGGGNAGSPFLGAIHEVQIWDDQALTAAEVVKLWDKEISYFQGTKAPSVAWLLDGPTCTDLIGDNDLTPVADPSAYSGSFGSTWLNEKGWNGANNLILQSEDFSSASWTKSFATVSANSANNPFGELTADKLIPDATSTASHRIYQDVTLIAEPHTFSVYAKADGYNYVQIGIFSSNAIVNLTDGTIESETGSPTEVIVTDIGSGWYRCEITQTVTAGSIRSSLFAQEFSNAATFSGDGTKGVLIFGAQLTSTLSSTDYYKTTTVGYDNLKAPKRWNADLDSDGNAGDANSFGPVKRNREYRNGPSITLDGTMGAATTYDASLLTELSVTARVLVTDTTGDQTVVDQSDGAFGWGFRVQGIDATTSELFFFHYPLAGGSADTMATATAIVTKDVPSVIGVSWDAASGDADFYVDEVTETESQTAGLGGIRADVTPMRIGLPNDVDTQGLRGKLWDLRIFEKKISADEFEWVRTQGESGTEPTNMVRHWPVIEEAGVRIQDIVAGDVATFINDPTWDFTANDEFFHGETVGYDSVGTFDGVDDKVDFSANTNQSGDFTFSAWIRVRDYTGATLIGADNNDYLRFSAPSNFVSRINGVSVNHGDFGFTWTPNELVHVMFERSGTAFSAYQNNIQSAGSTVSLDTINLDKIGGFGVTVGGIDFEGEMFDARIYSRVLTADERTHVYTFGASGTDPTLADCDLKLDFTDGNGLTVTDSSGNENDGTVQGATSDEFWATKIPAKSKSESLIRATPSHPAGPYHNRTAAEVTETPVANSDSVNPTYYGANFDGTLNANINADTNVTGYPFTIECDANINSLSGNNFLAFLSPDNAQYFGLYIATSGNVRVFRKSGGVTSEVVTSSTAVVGQWHKTKIVFESETEFTLTFDSSPELFTAQTSVTYTLTAAAGDLWVGQYRPAIGESPDFKIRNVVVKQGDTTVNDLPLYKDALGREAGDDPKHGTLSATGVSFLSNAMESDLSPDIAEHENRAVESGDRKIISIGAR